MTEQTWHERSRERFRRNALIIGTLRAAAERMEKQVEQEQQVNQKWAPAYGSGVLRDPALSVNLQADRSGLYVGLVIWKRLFWAAFAPSAGDWM